MKKIFLFFFYSSFAAAAGPLGPVASVATISDLTNRPAKSYELAYVLAASTNPASTFGKAILYRHRPDLSTTLHDPPFYFAAASGTNGVWESDLLGARYLDGRAFGIVGDGVTDNTAALQRAINSCLARNVSELWLPPGTNVISSVSYTGSLFIGGLAIRGTPGFRTILRGNSSATMLAFTSVRNFSIADLWLDANFTSTNVVELNDATQCPIRDCVFYSGAGTAIRLTGPQNYGHDFSWNNFVNFTNAAIVADAASVAAVNIADNTIQTSGGAYTNSAKGIWLRRGVANVVIYHNIIQRLYTGIEIDGNAGGAQLANGIDFNYFEAISNVPIKLNGDLHVGLRVTRNFFNQLWTTAGWTIQDAPGTTLYGFVYEDNAITPDAGKQLSLLNSRARGWNIRAASSDEAPDYSLPDLPRVMTSPSARLLSQYTTNFTVSAGATNLAIAGDLLPNRLIFSANSNASVSIIGYAYPNAVFSLYNAGTNQLIFGPTLNAIRPGTEDTFIYQGGAWYKERLPYLPDGGGTLYGSLTVTNQLAVSGASTFTGNLTANGLVQNPWGYISYGTFGLTNAMVIAAKAGAVLSLVKDGNYYVTVGTNGITSFSTAIELSAATNILSSFAGFASGDRRLYQMTKADVVNELGIVTYTATNGVSKSGSTFAVNAEAGTGITLSTNTGRLVIAGAYTEGNGVSISGSTLSVDLVPGSGIGFSTNGSGQITISNTGTNSGAGSTNGSALYIDSAYAQTGNFIDSPEIDPSISGTNVQLSIVANSIGTNKVSSGFRSFFKDRSTDTGTQTASTISDFADAQWNNLTNSVIASNNISIAYDTSNKKLMISAAGSSGGSATNAPTIAVDGVSTTNVNFADSVELLVTQTGSNVTYALATSGVSAGSYTNPTLSVDSKGRVTVIANGSSPTSSVATVDNIWKTVASVSFVTTNTAGNTEIDYTTVAYTGVGSNLTLSGSSAVNQAVYFNLEFSTPRSDTNYLVFADIESDRGINSATVFVSDKIDTAAGRETNGVTFAIVATDGTVNYTMGGRRVRVWVVDPNVLISGEELTSIDASLLTGTIDILRLPSEVATDSEVAAAMNVLTNGSGSLSLSNLTITGTMNVSNLVVPDDAYGAGWNGSSNVPTKNAIYDKIESMSTGGGSSNTFGSLTLSGRRAWPLIDDFIGGTTLVGDAGTVSANNSGSHLIQAPEPGHQGLRRVRLSTNGSPVIGWGLNGASVIMTNSGSDKWAWGSEIKIPPSLSGASGIEYGVFSGFLNYLTTTNNPTDGIFFAYQTNYTASSVNWVFVTMTSSTAEATDTGIPVSASGWYNLQWVMVHTNVVASIDGVPVATNTTQIPFGVALSPHLKFTMTSSAVNTRDVIVDALLVDHAD